MLTVGGVTAASSTGINGEEGTLQSLSASQELGQIEVSTRISSKTNELEVVMMNTGSESITITHLTPHVASVARGEFNFAALLKDGPRRLEAGEWVVVPLQHKPVFAGGKTSSLQHVLKRSMSVVTETDSFASVSIVSGVPV